MWLGHRVLLGAVECPFATCYRHHARLEQADKNCDRDLANVLDKAVPELLLAVLAMSLYHKRPISFQLGVTLGRPLIHALLRPVAKSRDVNGFRQTHHLAPVSLSHSASGLYSW